MSQINFFAETDDLRKLLYTAIGERHVAFVETGLFESAEPRVYHGLEAIPALGVAETGSTNQEPNYLVIEQPPDIGIRSVPQRRGGMRYSIDQSNNPSSIVFCGGGRFSDTVLIAGRVGTISDNIVSLELYRAFSATVKRLFKKVNSFYVGDEAMCALARGDRLTVDVGMSQIYDLRRN